MKTMVIQLRTGTMMNMDSNVAVKLAQAALDKGYGVRIFGYGEGVTLIKKGQDPKRFPNVGNETKEMLGTTVNIAEGAIVIHVNNGNAREVQRGVVGALRQIGMPA